MFSQFLYNASWPLVIIGGLIAFVSGAIFLNTVEKVDDPWKLTPVLGAFALGALLIIFGWSAPESTDGIKIVYKDRVVEKRPQYLELYKECMDDTYEGDAAERRKNIETCNNIAIMQSGKQMLLTRTVIQHRDRIVYKMVPWKDIFNTCIGEWAISDEKDKSPASVTAPLRDARIKLCGDIATEQSKQIVIQNERQY